MADCDDPDRCPAEKAAEEGPARFARKPPGARRLLVATIGAASVQFATGCDGENFGTFVANLMAAPYVPPPASSGAGAGAPAGAGGAAGQNGAAGQAGPAGAGASSDDLDAGADDDAGRM
jgi:hypothetical protein